MSGPLLVTKFYIPPCRNDLLQRLRLSEQLNVGLHRKLVLVSAPAGFGKTTVVANWVSNELPGDYQERVTWLSLDEDDNELSRFFTYFITALKNIEPGMGDELCTALSASQNPQIEVLLTLLINEIIAVDKKFIIVMDDYHVISTIQIHQAVQFLIDHQPPNLLLVITSRDEPFLPLSRLRARGEMIDLRARDLQFSHQEAKQYLNQIMDLELSDADILSLATCTEGWITGLHLVALSIQSQETPERFISKFTGGNRYIMIISSMKCSPTVPKTQKDFCCGLQFLIV